MWQRSKDVKPIIASVTTKPEMVPEVIWSLPTLTVAFGPLQQFRPKRGAVLHNRRLSKIEEMKRLQQHGVPVPRWQIHSPDLYLDSAEWGPVVVLKPATPPLRGVTLMPTEAIKTFSIADYPEDHAFRRAPIVVQQFIDTGTHPSATRVLTLFGEPIHCLRSTLKQPRPNLDASHGELREAAIATNQRAPGSSFDLRTIELVNDEKAIDLARAAAKAFPNQPLLGCDIVHDQRDGRSYVLEVNTGGSTWHFSSRFARPSLGLISRQQRIDQFGAWDIAARVLIEKAIQYAR
jgi:hypothetical protein